MLTYKKLLIFFGILSISSPVFSADDNQFDHLYHPRCQSSPSSYTASFDEHKYAQISGYMNIQPEFMDRVLSGPSETLEICAGQGQVLESILKKRNETHSSLLIKYTVVEKYEANVKKIDSIYKATKKDGDWVGCAQKDLVEFLETNIEKKRNKYDHIFGGFALHIFGAKSFVVIVNGLFDVLKEGGYLYLTQHSFLGTRYDDEYIGNVKSGQLLPFWVKDRFCSDPVTMESLLNAFGFQVIKNSLHQETYDNQTTTKYLGIIAQKNTALYNREKVRKYNDAADSIFQELDCANDINGLKARLSFGARESNRIWSIYDSKISEEYDALKVHTRHINARELLLEKFEIHPNNQSLVRTLNTFLFQVIQSKNRYETLFARVAEDHIISKILKSRFAFEKDETYQEAKDSQGIIQLKASRSAIESNIITM